MAAQCRSPRCTAERKGFRRELDSWRHRLIHCVGFESILEGLYGPGLRKDLSLFDDCEPQELLDWCVDDKCSLCNLRRDASDYTPSGGSAQSTPTGELISQGQFNTEKTECQAENYLNALFQKKDLPQNCDPNIPLVAQELMKKMIRQFAIEYISKSREMYQDSNGTIAEDPLGFNGIKKRSTESLLLNEQDGPLDLTVTRIQEQSFQDGVLDLSIKRNGSAFEENSKSRNLKNGVMNGYFLRRMKKSANLHKKNTALFKVMASWCLYHQQQLMGMLTFLKEEQDSCSETCHSSAQNRSAKQLPRGRNPSLVTRQVCANQKSIKSIEINDRKGQMHLPYLTVSLKDLRCTLPRLNLGTVKLNLNKKDDVPLSDPLLNCINTRSKKKKQSVCYDCLNSSQSTNRGKLPFSSLSKIKVQGTEPISKSAMIKHCLQCRYTQPGCQLEMTRKCCQTNVDTINGSYKTAKKNMTFEESCCSNGKQNRLKLNRKDIRKNSCDCSSSCVNFGSLIKHFLDSETNSFTELLNQKGNGSRLKVQTGFPRNIEKMSIFDGSLSDCQIIDFAKKLNNLTHTFPMEKKNFLKTSPNSINGLTVSVEEQALEVLVLKDCHSTKTKCGVQEKLTDLPHDTLKMHSKAVNCIRNSEFCLPVNFKCSTPQRIVNEKRRETKRRIDQLESTIPPKRYSRNTLGDCKLCDISHGLRSFQDKSNNLFCKCTIQKNSGIKNFKTERVITRSTTEKNRNTHLKVVVQRLQDSILSANNTVNCKSNLSTDLCKSNLCNSKIKARSCVVNVLQKTLNNVKQNNCLNSNLVPQANYSGVEATHESISEAATLTTPSGNSYFSPIKLMFVSKVESEDGVKYTLSSEYTPVNKHKDVELSDSVIQTSHTYDIERRMCKNVALLSSPECKSNAQNSSAKLSYCSDENHVERRTSRRKQRACQVFKNNKNTSESQHTTCSWKIFPKVGSSIDFCSSKTDTSKDHSAKDGKSQNFETYIVQNKGSGTQFRIKKVERFLRSSERNLHKHESESLKFQRISERLKKLRKRSNVSGMCKTNDSISGKGGHDHLSPFQKAITKCTEKEVNNRAKEEQNQKTIMKPKWTRGSLRIREVKCSTYNTRSRKSLATSSSSVPSNFSFGSALCHKSKKLHLAKCKIYKMRLRSFKQQCKLPLIDTKCTDNTSKDYSTDINLQPNAVLKWWSASTSKESLLKDFEKKYEQIANTWLVENNGEKDNEAQSLSTLKFYRPEMKSPVQMLFQKKCDIGDLAAWFMQTTETQSLSILRKANARNPLQKINRKGLTKKTKKPSNNSYQSKKHFKKCAQATRSETLTELFSVSKTSAGKCKVGQNPNNLQSLTDEDVCVKFASAEKHVDVTKACTEKVTTTSNASTKEIAISANIGIRSAVSQRAAAIPNPTMHIKSLGSSTNQKMLVQNITRSKAKNMYTFCRSKQNIKDCKVFLTKLSDIESKMCCTYRGSHSRDTIAGSKSNLKPEWKLKRSFTTKYCLQMNDSLARSPCGFTRIKNSTSKEYNFGMCLRKSKGSAAPYDDHSKSLILERRERLSKMTLYVESNTKMSKQIPNMGKLQSECPKFQLGPIKSVGIPAIRGLSNTGATYSLTPIRIPLQ